MNYNRLYDSIIQNAQARAVTEGYTETHHILPRSMGGADIASNLVVLTAREHYLVHYCLAKFTTGKDKASMVFAFNMMNIVDPSKNINRYKNSRLYKTLKEEASITMSRLKTGVKTNRPPTPENLKMLMKKNKERDHKACVTLETRKAISQLHKGIPKTKEHKQKNSELLTDYFTDPLNVLQRQIDKLTKSIKQKNKGYYKKKNRFQVALRQNSILKYFGSYTTEAEAAEVSLKERLKYLGTLKAELKELQI